MKYKLSIFYLALIVAGFNLNAQTLKDSLFEKREFIIENDTLLYRIMYPENFSEDQEYPVVLFLHGAGERGNDNNTQLALGSSLFTSSENRKKYPSIVVYPQCPKNDYWANLTADRTVKPISFTFKNGGEPNKSLKLTMLLLDELIAKPFTKNNQIYVMGVSMGGMGTYEILYRKPTTFAAAIPICGGGDPETTKKYALNTELWIFHGGNDDVVSPHLSINMVNSILLNGGKPNFTLFGKANHNSWDSTFAEPNLLPWLFTKIKN